MEPDPIEAPEPHLQLQAIAPTGSSKTAEIGTMKKRVLIAAAIGEAATGLALFMVPSLVGEWLLGEALSGVAIPVARVAGIALIALGIACWPGTPRLGMLSYSAAITLYLAYLGFAGEWSGILLWPSTILHAIVTKLLMRESTSDSPRHSGPTNSEV